MGNHISFSNCLILGNSFRICFLQFISLFFFFFCFGCYCFHIQCFKNRTGYQIGKVISLRFNSQTDDIINIIYFLLKFKIIY